MVAIDLAMKAGVAKGTCTVENKPIRLVTAPMAALCAMVSNERPMLSASPPRPRHFATGRMKSIPASSAMTQALTTSSHSHLQRSGALLTVKPPSQLALNRPNLNLFGPRIGFGTRSICQILAARLAAHLDHTTSNAAFTQEDAAGDRRCREKFLPYLHHRLEPCG